MRARLLLINEPPEFHEADFMRSIDNFLDMTAQAMQADYYVTVKTWKTKVDFIINNFGKYGRDIFTYSKEYLFVNDGTRVRYATMTPDFAPKSSPGIIRSYTGRGGVAFISKKHPRPGIKARLFNLAINKKWEKQYGRQWVRTGSDIPYWY